ncbi:MAG: FAD binding domain-containing protein [Armatimonadota bacterium]
MVGSLILPSFAYVAPKSLAEAITTLAALGPDAKLLAGGQSLIPLLSMRLARPSTIVDIGRLGELRYIRAVDGQLRIGALTRHRDVERAPLVQVQAPVLAAAAGLIGHSHIRNRGTIGGSLAHADPAAEFPAAVTALEASVIALGPNGEREIPAGELFLGPLTTALLPSEILTEVRVPVPPAGHGWAFREFTQRSGDFALVSACAIVTLQTAAVATCRIVVGGAGPVPQRCVGAEAAVVGHPTAPEAPREAAALAADEVEAEDDLHASSGYRRRLTRVLVRDALEDAFARLHVPQATRP